MSSSTENTHSSRDEPPPESSSLEPHLLSVLSQKFRSITNEMINTLLRTGRSGVLNTAMDFSCSITDARRPNPRIIEVGEGVPIHAAASDLIPREVFKQHDGDIAEGDCFLNNSPYHGNTHHADWTLAVPVFVEDQLIAFTIARAHLADTGAPIPSTYLPEAETVYQEGLHWPCVKVQEDYEDIDDIIRTCRTQIRVPDQWYGDYLAMVGAARIGEKRVQSLVQKYDLGTVLQFVDEWQEYGDKMMRQALRDYPEGTWEYESTMDPIPEVLPDGVTVNAEVSVQPDEEKITVDLTDNMDNQPCGFNLSEATVKAGVYIGIFNCLPSEIPHNTGSFQRIDIRSREGSMVGSPEYPTGTSVSTTTLCDRLVNTVQACFSQVEPEQGMAEGGLGMGPYLAVISGTDWRRDHAPFVNQVFYGMSGGPGVSGHDGWLTYFLPIACGVTRCDSLELDEQRYPILFEQCEIVTDSAGAGEFDGAPGSLSKVRPRQDPVTWIYINDGHHNPPRGINGGRDADPSQNWKVDLETGERTELPLYAQEQIQPDEMICSISTPGGGYGNPLDRDPERVRESCRNELISEQKAREVYGVVLDTSGEVYEVKEVETRELRASLREEAN